MYHYHSVVFFCSLTVTRMDHQQWGSLPFPAKHWKTESAVSCPQKSGAGFRFSPQSMLQPQAQSCLSWSESPAKIHSQVTAAAHRSISITTEITLKFVSTSLIHLLSYFWGSDVSYQIYSAHSTPAVAFLTGPVFSSTEHSPRLHNPTALSSAPLTPPHPAWVLLCSKLHSNSLSFILSLPSAPSSHPQRPGQAAHPPMATVCAACGPALHARHKSSKAGLMVPCRVLLPPCCR